MRSFWTKVDALEAWHASLVDKPWLQPLKPTKFVVVLIILSTLIAAGMNWYVRHWQYQVWEQNPQIFYLDDGTPLFTTTDAPYFLGLAKVLKDGDTIASYSEKRLYPENKRQASDGQKQQEATSWTSMPLLSVIISIFADNATPKALLQTGNFLIPISAVLTSGMVIFAFGAAGYWVAGSIAAAGGGLSYAYITRSGAGRIDTDQLNLGFFYLLTGLVILAARGKSLRTALLLAAVSGLIFNIFDWWYPKPVFGWAFCAGLAWLSFITHRSMKRTIFQVVAFLLLSGLVTAGLNIDTQSSYFLDNVNYQGLVFPNTFDTITEITQVPFKDIFERTVGSVWLGVIALVGLGAWAFRHPSLALVFAPAAGFVLLNFFVGNRAIFYSAPIFWFGLAWLLITLFRLATTRIQNEHTNLLTCCFAAVCGFVAVWFASPTSYVQGPTFDKAIIEDFRKLSEIAQTDEAVVMTWWDYGYTSILMNQLSTIHDGGMQTSPATYFLANSLLSKSQKDAAERLKLLVAEGSGAVVTQLQTAAPIRPAKKADRPVYLVLTQDMANWISSISKIGHWDIVSGKPKDIAGVGPGYMFGYEKLACQQTNNRNQPSCNGLDFNLETGRLGPATVLDGMVISRNGLQIEGRKFPESNSPFMVHSEIGQRGNSNMLIHRDLYFSLFHQLFHAGRYDKQYFELVYDNYPKLRVFALK